MREAQALERHRKDEASLLLQRLCVDPPTCAKCGKTKAAAGVGTQSLLLCSRCQCARYCSQQCQRSHWTAHRPTCKPPLSAIASYFQAMHMMDRRKLCGLPMLRGFVSLQGESKYDVFACIVALLQAIPGLSRVCKLTETLSRCLSCADSDAVSMEDFAALSGTDEEHLLSEDDLLTGVTQVILLALTEDAYSVDVPAEFKNDAPSPTNSTVKVKIPSFWRPGETIHFPCDGNGWDMTPAPATSFKAGDIISVTLKLKEVVTPSLSRSLKHFVNKQANIENFLAGVHVLKTSRDCANCRSSSLCFDYVETHLTLNLRVKPQARTTLEELLSEDYQHTCYFCQHNMSRLKGGVGWGFDNACGCYVMESELPETVRELPMVAGGRVYMASLPSLLFVSPQRLSYWLTKGLGFSFTEVDFPVRGLDMRPFYHPELPAPADACTLYDLCFVGELGINSSKKWQSSSSQRRRAEPCQYRRAVTGV